MVWSWFSVGLGSKPQQVTKTAASRMVGAFGFVWGWMMGIGRGGGRPRIRKDTTTTAIVALGMWKTKKPPAKRVARYAEEVESQSHNSRNNQALQKGATKQPVTSPCPAGHPGPLPARAQPVESLRLTNAPASSSQWQPSACLLHS